MKKNNGNEKRNWVFNELKAKKEIKSIEDFEKIKGNLCEDIAFKGINFSNYNFGFLEFFNCKFEGCNLSLVDFENSTLQDVFFTESKIIGVNFSIKQRDLLSVEFYKCQIQLCYFSNLKLKNISFEGSEVLECNFRNSFLIKSIFKNCDLNKTIFDKSDLSFANFIGAKNYSINPNSNILKKAEFSYPEAFGLLDYFDIKIRF